MKSAFYHSGRHGIILFLFLIAFAMVEMSSNFLFLPLFFFAVVPYVVPLLEYATSYLGVALTVSKIE